MDYTVFACKTLANTWASRVLIRLYGKMRVINVYSKDILSGKTNMDCLTSFLAND